MDKLVTIGVPVYKRLEYLPNVLKIVAAQDYPHIELLISDNGMNGKAVPAIVDKHYPKPYTFRQNAATVSGSAHYNQLIEAASGEYVIILADDDEISSNYVSELMRLLERHPEASVALGLEEVIDPEGKVLRTSKRNVPEILSDEEFVRSTFCTREYGYEALCTFLAKKKKLLECGGFPDIWAATSDEDFLMTKLALGSFISFSPRCSFRKRLYEASGGYAIDLGDLARGIREYLSCIDNDPQILQYAESHPAKWGVMKGYLVESAWETYYVRWEQIYRNRMTTMRWIAAGFALPFPKYLNIFTAVLIRAAKSTLLDLVKRYCPPAYTLYRGFKTKLTKTGENGAEASL